MIREVTINELNPYGRKEEMTFLVDYEFDVGGPILASLRSDDDILTYLESPKDAEWLLQKVKDELTRIWYENKADAIDEYDPFDVIKDTAAARREDGLMDHYYENKYGR
jgi:hypothetical protein